MASLLFFLSFIFSFLLQKSKLIAILIFGLMWVFFGWNYWNGDYDMYEAMYKDLFEIIDIFKYEGGYDALMLLSNLIGFDFQEFLIIVSAFILLSLLRFLLIFSKFPAIVAFFFMFAFFPLQFVLLRNFLAFSILLLGLIPLLKDSRYKYLKYIFAVLVASTIHISSFFYLLFLPAFFKKKFTTKSIYILVLISLALFVISQSFITSLIDLSPKDRNSAYNTGISQFLIYSFIQIINLYFVNHFLKGKNKTDSIDDKSYIINNKIIYINIIMLFLIVVYFKFGIFIRILINFSFVNMVFIINKFSNTNNKTILNKCLILLYLLFNFFMFVFAVKEFSLIPMFENNLLLD